VIEIREFIHKVGRSRDNKRRRKNAVSEGRLSRKRIEREKPSKPKFPVNISLGREKKRVSQRKLWEELTQRKKSRTTQSVFGGAEGKGVQRAWS